MREHLYTSEPGAASSTELGAGKQFGDFPIVTAGVVPRAIVAAPGPPGRARLA